MSRNLADLKLECEVQSIPVTQAGKKEAKSDYETALRDFYWDRDHSGETMPEQIAPMLARNSKDVDASDKNDMLADGGQFVAQEKINGCRCVMKLNQLNHHTINHLTSRRLSDETYRYNELHDKMPHYRDIDLGAAWDNTVIDGEVMAPVSVIDTRIFDGKGQLTVDILQATAATMNCGAEKSVAIQEKYGRLVLHVFDCLRFKGKDVSHLPYVVLDQAGDIDLSKPSRYGYAVQVVEAITEAIGELPCEHCSGVKAPRPELMEPAPQCNQDDFLDIIG